MHRLTCVLCCVLAAACGSSAPEGPTTPEAAVEAPPPAPLALLPSDTFAVLRLDLVALRASPYYPTITGWLDEAETSAEQAGQATGALSMVRATLDRADEVVVGFVPTAQSDRPDPLVVARGRFSEEELRRIVGSSNVPDAPVRSEQRRGFTVHVGADAAGAQIGEHTWLVGAEQHVDAMLGRYASGGGPLASDALRAMAERVELESATASFAMEVLPEVREQMRRRLRSPIDGVEEARRVGARLAVSDGIDLLALADMQSPEAASELAGRARALLGDYAGNIVVRMMGVGAVLESTTVDTEGASARLVTRVDDATTRRVLDQIGSFVRLALRAAVADMAVAGTEPAASPGTP